jgi:hypothetical protein
MNKSMTSKMLAGAVVLAALGFLGVSQAGASFTLEAVIFDGVSEVSSLHLGPGDVGSDFTIRVYLTLSGANTSRVDDKHGNTTFSLISRKVNGGAALGDLGAALTTEIYGSGVDGLCPGVDAVGATAGVAHDANGDGIGDIGSTSPDPTGSEEAYANGVTGMNSAIWAHKTNVGTTGTRVQLAEYLFHVGSLVPNAQTGNATFFDILLPLNGGIDTQWVEDNVTRDRTNSTVILDPVGSRVSFFVDAVPEPATMAFLAIGGFGMIGGGLARRRMRKA